MIIQELRDETRRFIQSLPEKNTVTENALNEIKQTYQSSLRKLGYSESYIKENCKRIEQRMQKTSDSVHAPLINLQENEIDVWMVEALKKQLLNYLVKKKKMDMANALYIVCQYVSLDGREMIHKVPPSSKTTNK